jgi:hypothetical protein
MSDKTFTPGPWTLYDDSNDGKTNRIEIVAIGKTVARIYHSVPDEDLPNAMLIAAAPELYSALQEIIDTEWIGGKGGFVKARAALAKARGES